MSASKHTIIVLAHEPGHGWIEYLCTAHSDVAMTAADAALEEGFDAIEIR